MLSDQRIKEAQSNVKTYLLEGLLKKQTNVTAQNMFLENSALSLETAQKLLSLETEAYKPYLWVITSSYYAMYYVANAVLLSLGYRVGSKISHKVTSDALIIYARHTLKKELIERYEELQEDALEIMSSKTDDMLQSLEFERIKRSKFQYQMDEHIKKGKALTSFERAKIFVFEMKKLL